MLLIFLFPKRIHLIHQRCSISIYNMINSLMTISIQTKQGVQLVINQLTLNQDTYRSL
jgi:D-Tyr-tRNAtyr deacylase